MRSTFAGEVNQGKRFQFGKNWMHFLKTLNVERIELARNSLQSMLGMNSLIGKKFVDVGSGSGLFSLAARQLGARVHSFDYDPVSVACTKALRERFFGNDPDWVVELGSILDSNYIQSLDQYDIVYSWGVLHHTGALWSALDRTCSRVRPGGILFISIYNDQGWLSNYWRFTKRCYNHDAFSKALLVALHFPYFMILAPLVQAAKGKHRLKRGMSRWHDMLDWLGGLPFEVALPHAVTAFLAERNFTSTNIKTCGRRHGCNEYLFRRQP
jgi:2-polyprenyl-3-methyl-5-hydroxy-6-metoxy-1,4-benzoquinol methylase